MEEFNKFTFSENRQSTKRFKHMSKAGLALLLTGILITTIFQAVQSRERNGTKVDFIAKPPMTIEEAVHKYDLRPKQNNSLSDCLLGCCFETKRKAQPGRNVHVSM